MLINYDDIAIYIDICILWEIPPIMKLLQKKSYKITTTYGG